MSPMPMLSVSPATAEAPEVPAARPRPATAEWMLWLAVLAYAFHVMEELNFNWLVWARLHGLNFRGWEIFYTTNATVMVFGFVSAMVGWRQPLLALTFPGLMLANGLFFHVGPSILDGRPNPGALTAVFFFLPLSLLTFRAAIREKVATWKLCLAATAIALAVNLYPVVLLKLSPLVSY